MIVERAVVIIAEDVVEVDVKEAIARDDPPPPEIRVVRTSDNKVGLSGYSKRAG
jgi:hypothetical protein